MDNLGMPGNGRGALVEEVSPQDLFTRRTPRDPLTSHARRPRGTAPLPVPPAESRASRQPHRREIAQALALTDPGLPAWLLSNDATPAES